MNKANERNVSKAKELECFIQLEESLVDMEMTFEKRKEIFNVIQKSKKKYIKEVNRRKKTEIEKEALHTQIQSLKYDRLSGAVMRQFFENIIFEGEGEEKRERKKHPFKNRAIIYADLNNLKKVNDKVGHDYGDQFIYQFASIITKKLRKGDIIVRYGGGDEFIILLTTQKKCEIEQLIQEINKELTVQSFCFKGKNFPLSAAFGVCTEKVPILQKIKLAEKMMYKQKRKMKWNRIYNLKMVKCMIQKFSNLNMSLIFNKN